MRDEGGFLCAPGLRLEAHERLVAVQFDALSERLERLESIIERLERRMWLAVYGVVAVIVTEAVQGILHVVP